jgi:hypothetical protein
VKDKYQRELFTWSFPISSPATIAPAIVKKEGNGTVEFKEADSLLKVTVDDLSLTFNTRRWNFKRGKKCKRDFTLQQWTGAAGRCSKL